MLAWLVVAFAVVLGTHLLAGAATEQTIGAMRAISDFANAVRQHDAAYLLPYNLISYPAVMSGILLYTWPLVRYARAAAPADPSPTVRRRALSAPLVISLFGFAPWLASLVAFPLLTLAHFGRWTPELMSQHILSPLINGFLAATASYFLLDWIFRRRIVPRVFAPGDRLDVAGARALGVRARLFVYLVAVAFVPMFSLLGLSRGAVDRVAAGAPVHEVIARLDVASTIAFSLYFAFGLGLTWLLAQWLTQPLSEVVRALRRVQNGALDVSVAMSSNDEIGVLADGVNQMVETLRDRERILTTFGRVVEPGVRDHLLAASEDRRGQRHRATVVFCDLQGFTSLSERREAEEVVATLNEFFAAMTAEVRRHAGFVDKFIGDALLGVFGILGDDAADDGAAAAARAVSCAAGMRRRLADLNQQRRTRGDEPLAMSLSVHTGPVVAGIIGSTDRHEFTVIGDTVNVASRLVQVCKEHGWDVLVTEASVAAARAAGLEPQLGESAEVTVRGRAEAVRVHHCFEASPVAEFSGSTRAPLVG